VKGAASHARGFRNSNSSAPKAEIMKRAIVNQIACWPCGVAMSATLVMATLGCGQHQNALVK